MRVACEKCGDKGLGLVVCGLKARELLASPVCSVYQPPTARTTALRA